MRFMSQIRQKGHGRWVQRNPSFTMGVHFTIFMAMFGSGLRTGSMLISLEGQTRWDLDPGLTALSVVALWLTQASGLSSEARSVIDPSEWQRTLGLRLIRTSLPH